MKIPDDCPYLALGDPITCSCIQSRGTADESAACFFRRRDCFGEDVVVRVSRTGDDLQICCSYQRLYHPIERMQNAADEARLEHLIMA